MKKQITFLALTMLMLSACGNGNLENETNPVIIHQNKSNSKRIMFTDRFNYDHIILTIELDGCEYLSYHIGGSTGFLTHKGNCKYCQLHQEETLRKIIREEQTKK
jgi:protein involved in sex pheromone biosynthesis